MSTPEDDFDPSNAGNFIKRYREARESISSNRSNSAPSSPRKTHSRSENVRNIWGSVFHPLGKAPTSADRYDLGRGQKPTPGAATSEVHAMGTGISLDALHDDE